MRESVHFPFGKPKEEIHSKTGRTFHVDPSQMHPVGIEGRVCIDLTDPNKEKILQRVQGKNHIFTESFFLTALPANSTYPNCWQEVITNVPCYLTANTADVDVTLPYLFGDPLGLGLYNQGASGTTRGAYNTVNSIVAANTLDSVRWKFQYDFTPSQLIGATIGTIGLSQQYGGGVYRPLSGMNVPTITASAYVACDGRYNYSCSSAGVITKTDLYLNTTTTIDVSAIVGTTGADYKMVGIGVDNSQFYVMVTSTTAANRKMYVFSDNSFSTRTATYSMSNASVPNTVHPFYVYGNVCYICRTDNYNNMVSTNFVNNVALSSVTITTTIPSIIAAGTRYFYTGCGSLKVNSKLIAVGMGGNSSAYCYGGFLLDLSTGGTVVAYLPTPWTGSSYYSQLPSFLQPGVTEKQIAFPNTGSYYKSTNAIMPCIAEYKLPETVTKTADTGLTSTYEIEVFWE